MSNFDEKAVDRIKRLEREVERLRVKERPDSGSGVTDHGALTGLSDNDHPQYLLTTGKAADSDKLDGKDSTYFAPASSVVTDHGALTGLADNDHPQYLLTTGKAADADKLDGLDSTDFATAGHNHNSTYLGITAKAADADKLDGNDSSYFATAGHNHTGVYLPIAGKAADSDKLANTTPSSYALTILDDENAAAVKTTLGLKITPHTAIADDAVYSFTPAISQGFLLYRKIGGASGAVVSFDAVTETAYCFKIAGSADIETRTGALTGTTGTDGKITISAHTNGKVYIENRLGSTLYGGYCAL